MNGLELLEKLATAESTDSDDDEMMQMLLRRIGFKRAVVVCGIVYLKGKGTIDAPPMSMQVIAKNILSKV